MPIASEFPAVSIVNGHAFGTAFASLALPEAAGMRHAGRAVSRGARLLLTP